MPDVKPGVAVWGIFSDSNLIWLVGACPVLGAIYAANELQIAFCRWWTANSFLSSVFWVHE